MKEAPSEAEEWKNKFLRALADYKNLEKRSWEEKIEIRKYAAETVLVKLLPVFDMLSLAQVHLHDPGLDLTGKELMARLAELGVERIETKDKAFNPGEMECIEVVEGTEGDVVAEVTAGYKLYGRLLRPARVKVGGRKE